MLKPTQRVKVVPCEELNVMHLAGSCGRTGTVTEQVYGRDNKPIGYMVLLDKSFQGEHLWFLPLDAVDYEEDPQ